MSQPIDTLSHDHTVHYGSKSVHRFAPAPHSVLSTSDFKSAAELAAKVKELMSDEAEYEKMIAWKTDGTSESFNNIVGA